MHRGHRPDGQRGPQGRRDPGRRGIHARVINIHTIKPLDEDIILKAARECGKIVTAEEHNVIGGLGEAVCAVLSEKLPTPVRRVGVQDVFGCSGPAWDLLKEYGWTLLPSARPQRKCWQVSSFSEITNAAVHCTAAFLHLTELLSAFPSRRTPRRRLCAGCISRGEGHPAGSAGRCPGWTDAAGCATRQGKPVDHRAEEHPSPGQQLGVDRLVVFHHPPDRCGIGHPRLLPGEIHHVLIKGLVKYLLPGEAESSTLLWPENGCSAR